MAKGKSGVVRALGAMSGTSLDGVDAAVIDTDGVEIADFGPSAYRPYTATEQAVLRRALGAWPGEPAVAEADRVVAQAHLDVLRQFTGHTLAGVHGQTLAHEPGGRGTHQVGAGPALAAALGVPVVWDFRSADVAVGGQGAPLAPAYHWALARWIGAQKPVAFLNLGGVGNLTWVAPGADDPFAPGALLALDTGPANAPLNDLMQTRRGLSHDAGGALAAAGVAQHAVVDAAMDHPFFAAAPPKSLDRDDFAALGTAVTDLPDADAAATLVAVVASCVTAGLTWCPAPPARVLVTGGGRHNAAMMAALRAALPCPVDPVEAEGLDGDMLEAQAFAYLAVRSALGLPISGPGTTGVGRPTAGGQMSLPEGMERVKGIEPSS